jgi:hypothetical protein
VIRQTISCDICGTEMLNANNWFVAYDCGPELRIGAWNPRKRTRASARHLCGHKCLHKLVDDFMARTLSARASIESGDSSRKRFSQTTAHAGANLTCVANRTSSALPITGPGEGDIESSARLILPIEQGIPRAVPDPSTVRAEAWKRERQRQAQQIAPSRRSIA